MKDKNKKITRQVIGKVPIDLKPNHTINKGINNLKEKLVDVMLDTGSSIALMPENRKNRLRPIRTKLGTAGPTRQ